MRVVPRRQPKINRSADRGAASSPYNAAPMHAQAVNSAKSISSVAVLAKARIVRGAVPMGLLSVMMLTGVCHADGTWSGSLGATSNYIYRGISQTFNGPALQLGGNYQSDFGWFAGAWGSNVDPYPGHGRTFAELNFYGGLVRPLSSDFTVKGTYTHYAYVLDPRRSTYDYDEIAVSVAYSDLVAATVSYQPNYTSFSNLGFADRRPATAYELTGRWPLRFGLAATAGAGYYDLHHLFGVGYWAGDVGLAYVYGQFTFGVSRFFVDATAARLYEDASANGTWAVAAVWRF
jgi:uncharacterized protein (TIGR02001 family)